jgi:hypothetical protein
MPYRLRYRAWVDYLPSGTSAMAGTTYNANSTGNPISATTGEVAGAAALETPSGGAQVLMFTNTPGGQALIGSGSASPGGNQLASADITTLLAAMSADLSTQMNAAHGRLQGFPSGGS